MSCRGRCGSPGATTPSRAPNPQAGSASAPSHRTVHLSMDRSPNRLDSMRGIEGYGNMRLPPGQRSMTPGPYGYPSQYESFAPQIDYNLGGGWMPKDINLTDLLDQATGHVPARFRRGEPSFTPSPILAPPPPPPQDTSVPVTPLLDTEQAGQEMATPQSQKVQQKRQESLIQWFDRSVEKELKKQKEASFDASLPYSSTAPPAAIDEPPQLNLSRGTLERLAGATASQIEICFDLRKEPETELTDAVDKLAKAEAMCAFANAVKAAEAAAVAAPPDRMEEAALASAREFQTDLKATSVRGELEGVRPIEIVGYVGVTKPKYPTKRK